MNFCKPQYCKSSWQLYIICLRGYSFLNLSGCGFLKQKTAKQRLNNLPPGKKQANRISRCRTSVNTKNQETPEVQAKHKQWEQRMANHYEYLESIHRDPGNLIKGLQAVQSNEGYVSDEAILKVSEYFSITPVEIEGVLSFYAQFKRTKPGKYKIAVCDGTACHIKGSNSVQKWVQDELHIKEGETDSSGTFSLETVACLGCCSLAPVMSINGKVFGKLDRKNVSRILREYKEK